jgi:tetratricopeptide (TPR) repeat protein
MRSGLDALYRTNDPVQAAQLFRQVLAKMPTHYGANYQLAVALDKAEQREQARVQWALVIQMAEAAHDAPTAEAARKALRDDEMAILMREGLDALYSRREPDEAADRFRKVLAILPTHYGATYQLAMALDASGKPAEARTFWERFLKMADAIGDTKTAETARERLKKKP